MPRAGSSGGGGFSGTSGGFSDPFGDRGRQPVYTPPEGEGSAPPDSGLTPGGFGLDFTTPGGLVKSMQQSGVEGANFTAGLGAALFGKDNGSMFGGLPVIGDLGRFAGDNPVSQFAHSLPGHAADAIGGGLERIPTGSNLRPAYDALPAELRSEFDKQIAEQPDIAEHIRHNALKAYAEQQQLVNPELYPTIDIPRGSLADTVGWLLGDMFGAPQRLVERGIAGAGRASGMNRLQEIEAIAAGGVPTGVLGTGLFAGSRNLSEVEEIALLKWQSGEWSQDQALTFLAASSAGLSHDHALQIAGTFATDPTVAGSLGAAGLSRLGVTGARLLATEAKTGARLLAGTGRWSGTERGTELIRLLSKPYVSIQDNALGRAAKTTRYIIDPLHAIGQKRTAQEALVDIASEATPRAVASAYGEANHLNVLHYARSLTEDGAIYDAITEDLAVYSANVARRVLAEQHQSAMLAQGLGFDLVQSVPGDIVDDLAKSAPKGYPTYVRDEIAKHRILNWDDPARKNLARRMESMYGVKTADEYLADIAKMNPDELGLLHAATYGRATRQLLNALGESVAEYTGNVPLSRVVLLNRDTLTDIGAKSLLNDIAEAELSPEAIEVGFTSVTDLQVALIKDAQARFPELRYITIDSANIGRSLDRFTKWLDNRIDSGVMPSQITRDELAKMPEPLRNLGEQIDGAWSLGFRPEDHLLWGLEFGLDGRYRAATVPWVDHVADSTPAFRPGRALTHNIAGQPIVGAAVRAATKPIDYIEAGLRTMKARVTSATITEAARTRFVARATAQGLTDTESRELFQGILDVAQVHRTSARGLRETDLWREVSHIVPQRLVQRGLVGKRELMSMVLDAYEGDLRFVGLTQKLTGRAKTLLQPLGGNVAGYVAEGLYPTVKFRLNAIFQTQERIEPFTLNAARGVEFALGNKLTEADRVTEGILQRLVDTSVVRAGDIDQMEFSAMVMHADGAQRVLAGSLPRDLWNVMSDVQGAKRVNMLRTFEHGLGKKLREVWEQHTPGAWDDIVAEYSARAGKVVGDDEAAVRYFAEQMLGNEVSVNRLVKPGAQAADFDAAINTAAWHIPSNLGELRPLELDFLAKRMALPLGPGKVALTQGDLRAALAAGDLKWDAIEDVLTWYGAHPDYIRRVRNALEFSWDGFWNAAKTKFNLSRTELARVQQMMVRSAEVRGMSPVEFVSQVWSPMIGQGVDAGIAELGKAVSVLRAPKGGGTPDQLLTQLADMFASHLDPSAQQTLLRAFEAELPGDIAAAGARTKVGRELKATQDVLARGLADEMLARLAGGPAASPDVERAVQQFAKWSKSALTDGLLSAGTPNPYSELLTRVSGIQTDLAAPFNKTEQLLVNQAMHAMRLKEQDAFRLQYFARDRSWLERSVNHPFFGIYPASYMWGKIAPEVIRFVAKEPFGVPTGALAYSFNDVQKAMAIQREYDSEFDAHLEKLGHSQAMWFAGYLLPAVPWDVGAAMPSWMRDIAAQGNANQRRVDRGQEPKAIELSRPLRKVADYVSPFRSVFQTERVLDEVFSPPEQPVTPDPQSEGSVPIGPLPAAQIGPTLEEQMQALTRVLADQ